MSAFWVIGGEYNDTRFDTIAPGKALEKHGPYETYEVAHDIWAARAWATIDDCNSRFQIVPGDDVAPRAGPVLKEGKPERA
ncbi:MAG TPA: DUF4170 domain-containing protein [Stellaceae bacterium]|nr:DUF4170 domain-containing protein [Stellaceae bacterium]